MHCIELEAHSEKALNDLAARVGKVPDRLLQEIIQEFLEDQRDMDEAETVRNAILRGEEALIPWAEVKAAHDL